MSKDRMPDNTIETIREKLDIAELVREYVPGLKKTGKTYKACCPFHQEKTPSFTVSPDKGLFYCFGCQTGGDIFAFLMKIENLSFSEAAKKLAERTGVEWKKEENLSSEDRQKVRLRALVDYAKTFYHKTLLSAAGAAARDYLKKRGVTKETAEKFELGFTPESFDGLSKAALNHGFKAEEIYAAGLGAQGQYGARDYFRSRIMFPIINQRGEAVGFGGRVWGEGEPKYLNSPETALFSKSRVLYGINFAGPEIRKADNAILLEGYMDVIGVMSAGVGNCVAPLGTSFSEEHAKLLKRYTQNATVLFDPDAAGIKASLRTALVLISQGLFVKVASLGEELDPDEFIIKHGKEKFVEVLQNAVDIIDFQADVLIKKYGGNLSPQNKTAAAAELMEIVSLQPDPIVKAEWVKIVSEKLNVEQNLLKVPRAAKTAPAKTQPVQTPQSENMPVEERDLAAWLLKAPSYIAEAEHIDENKFESAAVYEIVAALAEIMKDTPGTIDVTQKLIEKLPAHENLIIRLSVLPAPGELFNPAQDIKHCVREIEKTYLKKSLAALQFEIKKTPKGASVPEALKRAEMELQKQLRK